MRPTRPTSAMSTATATPTTTTPTTLMASASDSVTYGITVRQSNSIMSEIRTITEGGLQTPCPGGPD